MLYGTWRLYSGKGSFKFMKLQLNDEQISSYKKFSELVTNTYRNLE